jgi:hypothetical protein
VIGELADLAEKAAAQAAAVLRNGRRAVPRALSGRVRGRLRRALAELAVTIGCTAMVVAQARTRLAGQMPDGATRLVSLHDLMPARSSRDGSASRWSSAPRPRWRTTPTGSCSTTRSRSATPRRAAAGPRRRADQPPGRPRPAAVTTDLRTARPPSTSSLAPGAWSGWRSLARASPAPPAEPPSMPVGSGGWSSGAPAVRGGSATQAPLGLGPDPDRRHRWRQDLVRAWGPGPQPGQDQRADRSQAGRVRPIRRPHTTRS